MNNSRGWFIHLQKLSISINWEAFIIFVPWNQDKHAAHVRNIGQRYDKVLNSAPFVGGKTRFFRKSVLAEVIQPMPYKLKTNCRCPITSAFSRCFPCWPWAVCPATVRVGGSKRTCFPWRCPKARMRPNLLCLFFSKKFNTKSALPVHQPSTLPQKIDSRGGLFWCQKGLVVHVGKMNFYLSWPPPTPVLGPFAAKCNAFWCKTQCNMPLNAVRFGAKCSAFWC